MHIRAVFFFAVQGSRVGAVVRALASHQCDPGFILGLGVICGLSLLLVPILAPRGFSPGSPVSPSPQKPTFPNSNSIWKVFSYCKAHLIISSWKFTNLLVFLFTKGDQLMCFGGVFKYFLKFKSDLYMKLLSLATCKCNTASNFRTCCKT